MQIHFVSNKLRKKLLTEKKYCGIIIKRKRKRRERRRIKKYFERTVFVRLRYAGMAELADALDSGSNGRKAVQVQVLLPAPKHSNPNLLPIGETFGFVVYF